jgi:hypothetical protein
MSWSFEVIFFVSGEGGESEGEKIAKLQFHQEKHIRRFSVQRFKDLVVPRFYWLKMD